MFEASLPDASTICCWAWASSSNSTSARASSKLTCPLSSAA